MSFRKEKNKAWEKYKSESNNTLGFGYSQFCIGFKDGYDYAKNKCKKKTKIKVKKKLK